MTSTQDGGTFEEDTFVQLRISGTSFKEQVTEFETIFIKSSVDQLVTKAQTQGLQNNNIRSVAWKVFLGVLPSTFPNYLSNSMEAPVESLDWIKMLKKERSKYQQLVDKYIFDPRYVHQICWYE
jgi:hypothetical protein